MTSEERLAEIRRAWGAEVRELFAMLDEARDGMRAVIAAAYPAQPDATPTVRELCEHIVALHDAAVSAEKHAESSETRLSALLALRLGDQLDEMRIERNAARARAEDAERKLAALVASVASVRVEVSTSEPDVREVLRAMDDAQRALAALREAHADAAPVAERHDREVELRLLQRMSERLAADRIERSET